VISDHERRQSDRPKVLLSATVEKSGQSIPATIANLSSGGTLLLGPSLPASTRVVLRRHGVDVPSFVVWAEPGRSGVRFEQPLNVGSMLRTVAKPRRRHMWRSVRPGLRCAPLSKAESAMLETWATSGEYVLGE
jgi:hypothetical protein